MLRNWKLQLRPAREPDESMHARIVRAIADDIRGGRLTPGSALPGSRVLAQDLGVNRKTVVLAYDELAALGWIDTEPKRGSFVSSRLPSRDAARPRHDEPARAFDASLADDGLALGRAALRKAVTPGPSRSFGDGTPDTRLVAFDALSRAFRHALAATRANPLGYGDPRGEPALREAIAAMLRAERGLSVTADQICVVRGSQMGIFLAARLLVRPGDTVAFESLSYPPARAAFASCGASLASVELDEYGLVPESLDALCRRTPVRAVFTTPHHQFPTTVTLPADRRLKLLDLSRRHGFMIVEDDYDPEFHFAHSPVFPLASMDAPDRVFFVGSLSKVLAPGLRIGYVVASKEVIERCAAQIMLIDRQGNALTELAVAELMASGELRRHIRRAVKTYAQRRDLCATLVERCFGDDVRFALPAGGLALWLRLSDRLPVPALVARAADAGIQLLPGRHFSARDEDVQALRMGYGNLDERELRATFRRLGAIARAVTG
jgi:GntR family transcriptional regulator / MocR family aminotransferase